MNNNMMNNLIVLINKIVTFEWDIMMMMMMMMMIMIDTLVYDNKE